jgi:1,4-dihydroxy-6-naphthoate synthase
VNLTIAYSPCPNDTFMFHGVAAGLVRTGGVRAEVHLHDVETLNQMALTERFDVTKLSFHAWLLAQRQYELLGVGAALGFGCGPVIVADRQIDPAELAYCRIAVPGELTTAHLLLRLWAPQARDRIFTRYDRIMELLRSGQADAGVIIHEGRFVYRQAGFHLLVDLGQWWQEQTQLPIPLGCIAARKSLGPETIRQIEAMLRESITLAVEQPQRTADYVRQHAREMDEAVLAEHIKTFVNDYSLDLGDDGRRAVAELDRRARAAGIIP